MEVDGMGRAGGKGIELARGKGSHFEFIFQSISGRRGVSFKKRCPLVVKEFFMVQKYDIVSVDINIIPPYYILIITDRCMKCGTSPHLRQK